MKTLDELENMEDRELVHEVLKLQTRIKDSTVTEEKCSQIHNYHFASNELLKVNTDKYNGSAVIIGGIYDLAGKLLVKPITIYNGLSDVTINGLLDDMSATFEYKIKLKPTTKRRQELQ